VKTKFAKIFRSEINHSEIHLINIKVKTKLMSFNMLYSIEIITITIFFLRTTKNTNNGDYLTTLTSLKFWRNSLLLSLTQLSWWRNFRSYNHVTIASVLHHVPIEMRYMLLLRSSIIKQKV